MELMDAAMDRVIDTLEAPPRSLALGGPPAGLGRETYASFLLLAVTGFTLAGYVLIALLLVGAVR
jgi:hypothetical protein